MPWGDGTGPLGLGPMTGRAAGYCAGYPVPGYMNPLPGFGWRRWLWPRKRFFGRGFWGRGRGWWRTYWLPPYLPVAPHYISPVYSDIAPEQEKEVEKNYLEGLLKELEEEIKSIKERLKELSKESK
jgi:hypothetical protein